MKFYSSEQKLKQVEQDDIDKHVDEFIKNGNKISQIKMGETGLDYNKNLASKKRGGRRAQNGRKTIINKTEIPS
jgi:hypothetical protein